MGRRGTIDPLVNRKSFLPVRQSGPMQTPSSGAVWCTRARATRLSVSYVTMQQVPNGRIRRVGFWPRTSSSGVEGELLTLTREFRAAAIALCKYKVYFIGRWYGSEDRVEILSCLIVRIERSTRAACSPGGEVCSLTPMDPRGVARDMFTFSESPCRSSTR